MRCGPALAALVALACASSDAGADDRPRRGKRRPREAVEAPVPVPVPVEDPPPPEVAPAVSEPPPAPVLPPYTATPAGGKPLVTVVVENDLPSPAATEVLAGFARVLGGSILLRYRDALDLVEPPEIAERELSEADAALREANTAFDEMNLEAAKAKVESAIAIFRRHLPSLAKQEGGRDRLRDAFIRLAAIRFFEGDAEGCTEALRRTFALDPEVDYSPKIFPPQMRKPVVDGRMMFEVLGRGSLQIASKPAGAAVYLNGELRGKTPLTIKEVGPGPNQLGMRLRGHQPETVEVDVTGGGHTETEVQLLPLVDDPFEMVHQAAAELGAPAAPEGVLKAARRFAVDMVAVVRMARAGDTVTLTGYLYDQRPRQLVRKAEKRGPADQLGETGKQLANLLFTGVVLDGSAVKPPRPSLWAGLREKWGRFRGSKAFWPVVGGVAGVVVVGVVAGAAAGASQNGLSTAEQVVLFGAGAGP